MSRRFIASEILLPQIASKRSVNKTRRPQAGVGACVRGVLTRSSSEMLPNEASSSRRGSSQQRASISVGCMPGAAPSLLLREKLLNKEAREGWRARVVVEHSGGALRSLQPCPFNKIPTTRLSRISLPPMWDLLPGSSLTAGCCSIGTAGLSTRVRVPGRVAFASRISRWQVAQNAGLPPTSRHP